MGADVQLPLVIIIIVIINGKRKVSFYSWSTGTEPPPHTYTESAGRAVLEPRFHLRVCSIITQCPVALESPASQCRGDNLGRFGQHEVTPSIQQQAPPQRNVMKTETVWT